MRSAVCGNIRTLMVTCMPATDSPAPVFVKQLRQAGRSLRFSIFSSPIGWEVREEADGGVLRQVQLSDWHRVERARQIFNSKVSLLEADGWVEA
jgi:hypothetical protein